MSWIIYSIISTVGFAGTVLIITKLTQFNIKSEILNFYFWGLTTLAFFSYAWIKRSTFSIPDKSWFWFVLLAVVAFITNLLSVFAIKLAPNPGYVRALQAAQIVIVTIVSFFIFGSRIDIKAFMGIIAIMLGIVLIVTH